MNTSGTGHSIKAFSELLILTGLCFLGYVVFAALGIGILVVFTGVGFEQIQDISYHPEGIQNSRLMLLVIQGFAATGSFVIFPYLIRYLSRGSSFEPKKILVPSLTMIALVAGLSLLMMPVNAWLAAWNESLHLPGFLHGFQDWAFQKEKAMEKLTLFLVNFETLPEVVLGFLVIANIAGLSEEFFFRRMLQPRFMAIFNNPHAAIWVTAFIFSAIHIQFYGLIPRMVLGALFGYYYFWTGNIWISVLGHALNNGITLVGMMLYQKNISPINVDSPNLVPWYIGAVAAGITWSIATMVKEEAEKISTSETEKEYLPEVADQG